MSRYVIGLQHLGLNLLKDIQNYAALTQQPTNSIPLIYNELVSQSISKMCFDHQVFMGNLVTLPNWDLIDYAGGMSRSLLAANAVELRQFADCVRAFALALYAEICRKVSFDDRDFLTMEAVTLDHLVLGVFTDATYVDDNRFYHDSLQGPQS